VTVLAALGHALAIAGAMTWEILWALILGFALSGVVQAVVRRSTVIRLLGDDSPRALAAAAALGAASSSCSYAAVALARSLVRKGAGFTAAMVFEIASTNLVVELAVILALLVGWQFTLAEFVGGPIMIILVAVCFRSLARGRLIADARQQAERGLAGSMEGHAAMDMSVSTPGSAWSRLRSQQGFTAVSHVFVMEWAAVVRDIVGGLLIAGALAAWVPTSFWRHLFLSGHSLGADVWGPIVGPALSLAAFVCSIGNVPLAAVLWNGGLSFGGVVSFVFADLIIVPILLIYRRYYGLRMAAFIFASFYLTMTLAGYVVELVFGSLGLVPTTRGAQVLAPSISLDYTTWLNVIFIALAAVLLVRFLRTGGVGMLAMMGGTPDGMAAMGAEHGDGAAGGHVHHRPRP